MLAPPAARAQRYAPEPRHVVPVATAVAAPADGPDGPDGVVATAYACAAEAPRASEGAPRAGGDADAAARHRSPDAEAYLRRLGLPAGLREQVQRAADAFAERIWIIDNSGSMATCDGHVIVRAARGEVRVSCSRWEELCDAILYHGTLAARLRAPTRFVLLNPPVDGAPQSCDVGFDARRWLPRGHDSIRMAPGSAEIVHDVDPASAEAEVVRLRAMLAAGPAGGTPLCAAVRDAVAAVAARAAALRGRGRRACVVIASDGAASDGDVEAALRPLRDLPAWVVVRLCTDDDAVVSYWNGVDEDLELGMDVLDDLAGEAREVGALNPWLAYPEALHRVREWGAPDRVFDLLDERALTPNEARRLAALVLGGGDAWPHPELDFAGFAAGVRAALAAEPAVWCPVRRRRVPWIDLRALRRLRPRRSLGAGLRAGLPGRLPARAGAAAQGSAACLVS